MAWWKKFLIYFSVVIGVLLIAFFILFALISNYEIPQMELGRYNLTKITQASESGETTVEEFADGEYYITVGEDLEIISTSADKGIVENEVGYNYFLHSEELIIFLQTEEGDIYCYGYYYKETKQIKVYIEAENSTFYYHYQFVETAE